MRYDIHNHWRAVFMPDMHLSTLPVGAAGGWLPVASRALYAALDFCQDFNPHVTILGGDFMEFDLLSVHEPDNIALREKRRLQHDFDFGNQILDRIDGFTKRHKVYIQGNHETRLSRWLSENPMLEGFITLDQALRLKHRGYEIIPEGRVFHLGKAAFAHGWHTNLYHAAKSVTEAGGNIFYGHTHDVQAHTRPNIDQSPIIGQSVGCLCDLNPTFMRGRPNKWVNGFGAYYFFRSGQFTAYNPVIINGKLIWGGRTYDGNKG